MKKLISLSFLCLLLYNMFSTGIALMFFKDDFSQATEASHEDQWIEVKVAVSLPYTADFVNTAPQGKLFEYKGEFYNIVEQRYQNDTLITKIKTNQKAKKRFESLADEALSQVDKSENQSQSPLKKALSLFKNLFSQYLPNEQLTINPPVYCYQLCSHQFDYQASAPQSFFDIVSPPPQV